MSTRLVASFHDLTPDRILAAVEGDGRRATGYAFALNSLENRVYDVELEDGARVVAKFYRPGRWSRAAILAEHRFLAELHEAEVPVVTPIALPAGGVAGEPSPPTLGELPSESGPIFYALSPRARGRVPDELDDQQLLRFGRLVARLHDVGGARREPARDELTPASYGTASLDRLAGSGLVPPELAPRYLDLGRRLVEECQRVFDRVACPAIRVHGDCHLGNLLLGVDGPFFLDFDDFLHAPPVQDLWLLAPGHDEDADRQRALLVEGYQQLRDFDPAQLALVEPLRGLRILRYAAWIAQRWDDPAFRRTFPDFLEPAFWSREAQAVEQQRERVRNSA